MDNPFISHLPQRTIGRLKLAEKKLSRTIARRWLARAPWVRIYTSLNNAHRLIPIMNAVC
jgi:hypothetical protein